MKTLSAVLFLVLLCSVQLVYSSSKCLAVDCCVDYYNKRIPLSQIVSFYVTSSSCRIRALMFVIKRNRSFCVNPEEAWVSNHVTSTRTAETINHSTNLQSDTEELT
uniref:Chemokine interleukin-8-like domain-containing protein n=1 Tax=Paramormyrops kingsleyae TaxID=1676925 RepID=A0A3B3Q365_9TELE